MSCRSDKSGFFLYLFFYLNKISAPKDVQVRPMCDFFSNFRNPIKCSVYRAKISTGDTSDSRNVLVEKRDDSGTFLVGGPGKSRKEETRVVSKT